MVTIRHETHLNGQGGTKHPSGAIEQSLDGVALTINDPRAPEARVVIQGVNNYGHRVSIRIDGPTAVELFNRLGASPESADLRAGRIDPPAIPRTTMESTGEGPRPRKGGRK